MELFLRMSLNHNCVRFLLSHNTTERNKESHLLPVRYLPSLLEGEEEKMIKMTQVGTPISWSCLGVVTASHIPLA